MPAFTHHFPHLGLRVALAVAIGDGEDQGFALGIFRVDQFFGDLLLDQFELRGAKRVVRGRVW